MHRGTRQVSSISMEEYGRGMVYWAQENWIGKIMSDHLHNRLFLKDGDVVEVDCDTEANVILMDDAEYANYRGGRSYRYFGGFFRQFPATLVPPNSGYWNIVLDLGGRRATVRHSIRVLNHVY
jgi:hypothetical protein